MGVRVSYIFGCSIASLEFLFFASEINRRLWFVQSEFEDEFDGLTEPELAFKLYDSGGELDKSSNSP